MTKLINVKGVVALAMALSFCIYSVAPNNSPIASKPITSYEAQNIKGGALPLVAAAVSITAADAVAPNDSPIVSTPITSYEAQYIEGGALPVIMAIAAVVAADAIIIAASFALYAALLSASK